MANLRTALVADRGNEDAGMNPTWSDGLICQVCHPPSKLRARFKVAWRIARGQKVPGTTVRIYEAYQPEAIHKTDRRPRLLPEGELMTAFQTEPEGTVMDAWAKTNLEEYRRALEAPLGAGYSRTGKIVATAALIVQGVPPELAADAVRHTAETMAGAEITIESAVTLLREARQRVELLKEAR